MPDPGNDGFRISISIQRLCGGGKVLDIWPDWEFQNGQNLDPRPSLRNLARYANPLQAANLGLGLGLVGHDNATIREQADQLAGALVDRRSKYTLEPYNKNLGRQIVRTTQELLDGSGTCLDFAVTLAALCVRENIPVAIGLMHPDSSPVAHAFVVVCVADEQGRPYRADGRLHDWRGEMYTKSSFSGLLAEFESVDGKYHLIDATPVLGAPGPGDLLGRQQRTLGLLGGSGVVYLVNVQAALRDCGDLGENFYTLPGHRRELGITSFLPDPPARLRQYPSRVPLRDELRDKSGRIVMVGESGTGKSTLALDRAVRLENRRGWFLDASDRVTLLRSIAAAEAHSRGAEVGSVDSENLGTLTYQARRRLASSERSWVVVLDNANTPGKVNDLFPEPRPATESRAADLLIVTTTDWDWAAEAEQRGWHRIVFERLTDEDIAVEHEIGTLADEEKLPELASIVDRCASEGWTVDASRPPGVARIVRAALHLGSGPVPAAGEERMTLLVAMTAASFMPAEQISRRWLARAVFDDDVEAADRTIDAAADAMLLERSRFINGQPSADDTPIWIHRLIRAAVRDLITDEELNVGLAVLATYDGSQRYSTAEANDLADFVRRIPADRRSAVFVHAATTVLDLLETRGRDAVRLAGALAGSYVDSVPEHVSLSTPNGLAWWATAQMALARVVNHEKKPPPADMDMALDRCRRTIEACDALLEQNPPADETTRRLILLRGRARAMFGVILKKQAGLVAGRGDGADAVALYHNAIDEHETSFKERRKALLLRVGEDGHEEYLPDPERHIDRGWYNLGGVNVQLAKALYQLDRGEAGVDKVATAVSAGLKAYAGSLSFRRTSEPTKYAAASLWGIGLAMYTAALLCPGHLTLDDVVPTDELTLVRQVQSQLNLLRVGEDCVAKALGIWAEVDGPDGDDTRKARDLLLKILLVRHVDGDSRSARVKQFWDAVAEAAGELDLGLSDPPDYA